MRRSILAAGVVLALAAGCTPGNPGPQPTRTPTPTPSASTSPSPSPTTTPSATTSPSVSPSTSATPDSAAWPSPANTGTPAGWTPASTRTTDLRVTAAGAVVQDVRIVGADLIIDAPNVTVRRVEIQGGRITNMPAGVCRAGLLVEDVSILGDPATTSTADAEAVGPGGYTARRVKLDGVSEGFRAGAKTGVWRRPDRGLVRAGRLPGLVPRRRVARRRPARLRRRAGRPQQRDAGAGRDAVRRYGAAVRTCRAGQHVAVRRPGAGAGRRLQLPRRRTRHPSPTSASSPGRGGTGRWSWLAGTWCQAAGASPSTPPIG